MRTLFWLTLGACCFLGCGSEKNENGGNEDGWGEEAGVATGGTDGAGVTGSGSGESTTDDGGSADGGGSGGGTTSGGSGGGTSDCTDYTMSLVEGGVFLPAVVRVAIRIQCDGNAVPDKTEGDFSIFEDGTEVSSFESNFMIVPTVSALRLASIMLIDMSGSIVETGSLPTLQLAALSFIEQLGEDHEVAIYLFDGREELQLLQPLTKNHAELSTAISSLDTYETYDTSTNLNGAIISGIGLLDNVVTAETDTLIDTSMVVFTDGTDMASYHSNDEATLAVGSSEHAVYSVSLGSDIDAAHMAAVGRDGHYSADDLEGLEAAFDEVGLRINNAARSVYILAYCSPRRSGEHELELKLNGTDASLNLTFDATGFGAGCSSEDFLPPEFLDLDGDGYRPYDGDCDDDDERVFPGAVEEASETQCMRDGDGDGFGDPEPPFGFDAGTDCDDDDGSIFPGAVDEAESDECMYDADGDGFGDDVAPYGFVDGTDCDDDDVSVYPGATETVDGDDEDCDGTIDEETDAYDDDGDGLSELEGDCDDDDIDSTTTDTDADCDGVIDAAEGSTSGGGTSGGGSMGGTSGGTSGGSATGGSTGGGTSSGGTSGDTSSGGTSGGSDADGDGGDESVGGCQLFLGCYPAASEAACTELASSFGFPFGMSAVWLPDGCPETGGTTSGGDSGGDVGGSSSGGSSSGGSSSGGSSSGDEVAIGDSCSTVVSGEAIVGIVDCSGDCQPTEWYDDGTYCDSYGDVHGHFDCAELGYDGGDCEIPDSSATPGTACSLASGSSELAYRDCAGRCVLAEYALDFPGDGFCDRLTINLNCDAYDWDGGDCCLSTCVDGPIYTCETDFETCLDPDAF